MSPDELLLASVADLVDGAAAQLRSHHQRRALHWAVAAGALGLVGLPVVAVTVSPSVAALPLAAVSVGMAGSLTAAAHHVRLARLLAGPGK